MTTLEQAYNFDEEERLPIRTDIPVTIHPDAAMGYAKPLNIRNSQGAIALGAAREALKEIFTSYADMNDTELALHATGKPVALKLGDKLPNDGTIRMVDGVPTRHIDNEQYVKACEAAYARTAKVVDAKVRTLTSLEDQLHTKVAAAITNPQKTHPESIALAQETRNYVKNLKDTHRFRFVAAAIERGDRNTAAAIISAPSFLSGFDDASVDTLRSLAEMQFAPMEKSQLEATKKAIAHVTSAGSALLGRVAKAQASRNRSTVKADAALKKLAEGK
jgi:hypothetical protein